MAPELACMFVLFHPLRKTDTRCSCVASAANTAVSASLLRRSPAPMAKA